MVQVPHFFRSRHICRPANRNIMRGKYDTYKMNTRGDKGKDNNGYATAGGKLPSLVSGRPFRISGQLLARFEVEGRTGVATR